MLIWFLATGKLNPEAIPGKGNKFCFSFQIICFGFYCKGHLKMQGCLLGLEFSGLNSSGQRVMGLLSAKGSFRNKFSFPENDNLLSFSVFL